MANAYPYIIENPAERSVDFIDRVTGRWVGSISFYGLTQINNPETISQSTGISPFRKLLVIDAWMRFNDMQAFDKNISECNWGYNDKPLYGGEIQNGQTP